MPKSTVMIVEDRSAGLAGLRKLIAESLLDCEVISAGAVDKALDFAESRAIEGAIIDVQMGDADGMELCRLLKSNIHTTQIPVMLVSRHD